MQQAVRLVSKKLGPAAIENRRGDRDDVGGVAMHATESMIGMPVSARDGTELGKVKEVRGHAFKLDAPMQFDYWLPCDVIDSDHSGRVMLSLDSDQIHDYKMNPPEEGTNESMSVDTTHHPADDARIDTSGVTAGAGSGGGGNAMPHSDRVGTTSGWSDASPRFREQWQARHTTTGTWEEYEPGFHFGYEMASDPRFMGRTWEDLEPQFRTEYSSWSGRGGATSDEGEWDRVRDHTHEAWRDRHAA